MHAITTPPTDRLLMLALTPWAIQRRTGAVVRQCSWCQAWWPLREWARGGPALVCADCARGAD